MATSRSQTLLFMGAAVIIIIVGGAFFLFRGSAPAPGEREGAPWLPTSKGPKAPPSILPPTSPPPTSSPSARNVAPEEIPPGAEDASAETFMVQGGEYYFSPKIIRVRGGSTVKVTFQNMGTIPHDFVLEELGVRTQIIVPGETDTIEFQVPDKQGGVITYTSYCSLPGHREAGMTGTFMIE